MINTLIKESLIQSAKKLQWALLKLQLGFTPRALRDSYEAMQEFSDLIDKHGTNLGNTVQKHIKTLALFSMKDLDFPLSLEARIGSWEEVDHRLDLLIRSIGY